GVFLGASKGIRAAPDGCSKGAVSERNRFVASAACADGPAVAPNRLGEGDHCHAGTSQAALRRASLRCELDCGRGPRPASQSLPSKKGSAGGAGVVRRERRKSATRSMVAGGLLPTGKARERRRRKGKSPTVSAAQRLQGL